MTILDVRASMFSQAKFKVIDRSGKEIENDPFLSLINNPNYFQSRRDFLYSHEWFKSLGNNYARVFFTGTAKTKDIGNTLAIHNLIPSQINFNNKADLNKFIFAPSDIRDFENQMIRYTMNGSTYEIRIGDIIPFYDLTNGLTDCSLMKSPSRVESLIPVLSNIERNLEAKNINLKMSAKHLISNEKEVQGMQKNLSPEEKEEIEGMYFGKNIIASTAKIRTESMRVRFMELLYDEQFASDIMKVAQAYNINRDVLNYHLQGTTTYDNQEKGIVQWIQGSIQPEIDDFANSYTSFFGYDKEGKQIVGSYEHLPIMQFIERERAENINKRADTLDKLVKSGVPLKEAREIVGL